MPEAFDAYYKWLGISPKDQPPNHYRLLGIDVFEDNPEVITSAADKQMAHIRSFQTGKFSALSQKILNEIAAARICLLNAAKKAAYDDQLRGQLAALESRPQQAEAFDPSKIGLDFSATSAASVVPRQSHGTKSPWQLPAAIAAAILASVAIIACLRSNPPEGEKPVAQAKADAPSKHINEGTLAKPKAEEPPIVESRPEAKREVEPESRPEPEPPKAESKPQPQPEPQPAPDPPEKTAARVKDAFTKAKTAADFKAVAVDALKLIDQANTAGKQDLARSVVTLALSAARKAENDALAKTATLCVLEPATRPVLPASSSFDNRDAATAGQRKPRLPVPDANAQEQALKLVKEVFKGKYAATTSDQQKALSQELFQNAKATADDATAQYVMLKEAGRFAVRAEDADLAFQVIEEWGAKFEVDAFDLKARAMASIGKSNLPRQESRVVVGKVLALMEEAQAKEKFDAAKELGTTVVDLARKSKDPAFIKGTVARKGTILREMAEIQRAQGGVAEAVEALDKNPTDPAANLALGKYRCFTKNLWDQGIPMLALGDDPALKDLAVKELKGMTDAAAQTNLGDAWWDLGEKNNGLAKKNIRGHAASWYQEALPGLTGLAKEKVEKRLRESTGDEVQALLLKLGGCELSRTSFVGAGNGGDPYEDLPQPRRLLVGFNITTSLFSGTPRVLVVSSIQPIYLGAVPRRTPGFMEKQKARRPPLKPRRVMRSPASLPTADW